MQGYGAPLQCRYDEDILSMILEFMEVPAVNVMRAKLAQRGKSLGTQKIADSYEALRRIGVLVYGEGRSLKINPAYIKVDRIGIYEKESSLTGRKRVQPSSQWM